MSTLVSVVSHRLSSCLSYEKLYKLTHSITSEYQTPETRCQATISTETASEHYTITSTETLLSSTPAPNFPSELMQMRNIPLTLYCTNPGAKPLALETSVHHTQLSSEAALANPVFHAFTSSLTIIWLYYLHSNSAKPSPPITPPQLVALLVSLVVTSALQAAILFPQMARLPLQFTCSYMIFLTALVLTLLQTYKSYKRQQKEAQEFESIKNLALTVISNPQIPYTAYPAYITKFCGYISQLQRTNPPPLASKLCTELERQTKLLNDEFTKQKAINLDIAEQLGSFASNFNDILTPQEHEKYAPFLGFISDNLSLYTAKVDNMHTI